MARNKRQLGQEQGQDSGLAPGGFAEDAARELVPAAGGFAEPGQGERLKVGPGGRVLIPADMRAALGVTEGDTLLATLEQGELRLLSVRTAIKRAQRLVRDVVPASVSLVDDLLAERRRDFEAEERKFGGKRGA